MGRVLVACEESQVVTKAFRDRGHEAYSCDTQECSGGHPEWHYQQDVEQVLSEGWDLIIAHPPCTYLAVSGNRWYAKRPDLYEPAAQFAMMFERYADKVCVENPVGRLSRIWRKPDQYVHPYWFGDPFEKRTALWLKGLPLLKPTCVVEPPARQQVKGGKSLPEWYSNASKAERGKIRSKTFEGFANAMADQWGSLI